ncbi:MAG: hypothetical protein J1E01_01320 [Acetatifactor sp.]|nr:hypothetical protein [Acetatifactor sp.]
MLEGSIENLKCPYCGFTMGIFIPFITTDEELKMLKECPCGKQMESEQEIKARMERQKIKEKSFYTMIRKVANGEKCTFALKKEGVEFERCGITLYAYQKENYCHIIDPETGLSIQVVCCSLDTVTRHISRNAIKDLLSLKYHTNMRYTECKKVFEEAERIETLDNLE